MTTDTPSLSKADETEFTKLIAEDLESGALEKVIELFRYNASLYLIVGHLLRDDRMKVRLGANMLMDTLCEQYPEQVQIAVPGLLPLLSDESPTIRGDAADILGMIGTPEHIPHLEALLEDLNPHVVEIADDAISLIKENNPES